MTPEHNKYWDGDEPSGEFKTITEHTLRPMVFWPERHASDTVKFFRCVDSGGGWGSLPEVRPADFREGDTILIVDIFNGRLTTLRVMHITRIDNGEFFYGLFNDFLCFSPEDLIDRFAGLLGRVPTE